MEVSPCSQKTLARRDLFLTLGFGFVNLPKSAKVSKLYRESF